jgi:hypothetical protein
LIYAAGRPHPEKSAMHKFVEKFFLKFSASNSEVKLRLMVKLMGVCLREKRWIKLTEDQ